MNKKYLCQSYYDEKNTLRDCTCGKCKEKEVVIAEAIQRQKAKDRKRQIANMKDDCEIDEQVYVTSFRGTHPTGEDANKKNRQDWIKEQQKNPDPYVGLYKLTIWFAGLYMLLKIIIVYLNS